MLPVSSFAFVDLETTGTRADADRITEIGIVRVDLDGEGLPQVAEWSTLVDPEVPIPPAIQVLTGITDSMVASAPTFSTIAGDVAQMLGGRVFVAHNARFDYGFLKHAFARLERPFAARVLCTVRLSRRLFPEVDGHGLDALIARHSLAVSDRHRALGDARAIWSFVQLLYRERQREDVDGAIRRILRLPSLPPQLAPDAIDVLPESSGVYLFYGDNPLPLYVGKSINLRSRVMAHFSGDHRSAKDMKIAQQIKRVDWLETAGELGALIEEARLVKSLAPVYNRRLRRTTELCAWRWRVEEPATAPRLVTARELEQGGFDDLHGLFRSRAAAIEGLREIAAANQLCPIVLGLEKGNGPCFAHQLKRCRGACVGKESRVSHALRLAAALAQLKMRPWPFRGRIGVREKEAGALIVLDRWCYLGTVRSEAELGELAETRPQPVFDADTYKILSRFFASARKNYQVVELAA